MFIKSYDEMCHVVTAPIDTHYLKSPDFYTVFLTISNYLSK